MTPASLTAVARHYRFIRETLGPNKGFHVAFLQRFCGGQDGDSWCADFVSFVLDIAYLGQPPLPRSGATRALLSAARVRGWVVDSPQPDDLYFFTRPDGIPHHVGIVTMVGLLGVGQIAVTGIAGNTSEDGTSSNGTGVFEHPIPTGRTVWVRLPR